MASDKQALSLPPDIGTTRQLRACIRQLESIENSLISSAVRQKTTNQPAVDVDIPELIGALIDHNHLELKSSRDVRLLKKNLESLIKTAQHLRFTFASEPDRTMLLKLVEWARKHLDKTVLVDVAVSPYIAGGFILQTPMRRYDFSWRARFEAQPTLFAELLKNMPESKSHAV